MPNIDNGRTQNRDVDWKWWDQRGDQNFVKQKNIFRSDISLQRRMFWDACTHSGYKVEYFETEEEKRDLYYDPVVRWKDSIILPCIFDEHPKIKLLKDYGWFTDDTELGAQILYLSMYKHWETKEILDLQDQSLFRITYFGQNYPSDFRLTEKRLDSVYGVYWICKLAPERLDNFYYITDHGTHFLKRKEHDSVNCEHKQDMNYDKDERIYQHQDLETYLFGKKGESNADSKPFSEEINNDEFESYSQLIMGDIIGDED